MKDNQGFEGRIVQSSGVTLKRFAEMYHELSESQRCLPVASNLFPIIVNGGPLKNDDGERLYDVVIFYKTKAEAQEKPNPSEESKGEQTKELPELKSLDLGGTQ